MVECGFTDDQFWRLTPAKLFAIIQRKNEQIRREDFRAGLIAMLIRQVCGKERATPFDDFPHHKRALKRDTGNPAPSEVRANFRAYMEAMKKNGT